MKSFNFQIVNVANLAAITTPFPDHICYFTEDLENYYIWENNALKEIFVDASSISWNDITNKPTTINGFGITDAVKVNNGTLNYVAKFTPNETTIGSSRLYEDTNSFSIGLGPSAFANTVFYVQGTTGQFTGGSFVNHAGGTSNGYGLIGTSNQTAGINIGVAARAQGVGATENIGAKSEATGAAINYSIQLIDGTQTVAGRYLRNMTTNGKANWANINITEVTNGLSSTLLGAPNGIATLDNNSKLTISQMPISVMDYKGTYDIVTNTPSLVDGVGNQGDVYVCTTAGTRTFGPGNTITVEVGDWLIYNGTKWEKTLGNNVGSGTVTSVGLSLGTAGNDVSVSNSPITSSGSINLNLPSASASARGLLTSSDWSEFKNKVGGSGSNNYIAKFTTPDGKTIGSSQIRDNGSSIGIGKDVNTSIHIDAFSNKDIGFNIEIANSTDTAATIGVSVNSIQGNSLLSKNIGVYCNAAGANQLNIGVDALVTNSPISNIAGRFNAVNIVGSNIGVYSKVQAGANNYFIQLEKLAVGGNPATSTSSVVGRYLRNMTTDGKADWANIQVSEVTGAVAGAPNGTADYVARWTPDNKTIGIGKIRDDGDTVGINTAPNSTATVAITSNTSSGLFVLNNIIPSNGSSIKNGISINVSGALSDNRGIDLSVSSGTTNNTGINAAATGTAGTTTWGAIFSAQGAGTKYSVRLVDGTNATNKFLKSVNTSGDANWAYIPSEAQIMCSDLTTGITASAAAKAFWHAPCDGQFTDIVFYRRSASGTMTVEVRKVSTGALIASVTFGNGTNGANTVTTSSFSRFDAFDIFVTATSDSNSKGLLATFNYNRT